MEWSGGGAGGDGVSVAVAVALVVVAAAVVVYLLAGAVLGRQSELVVSDGLVGTSEHSRHERERQSGEEGVPSHAVGSERKLWVVGGCWS